ncbi:MAG: hypothetical protein ACD_79C00952G0006 [uncultured bacterium]|nr:MAG: hypothetical protein ACD_79C00952G0006 [uncultured bacterium]
MLNLLSDVLNESIQLESNLSELYLLFSGIFPDYKEFWYQLSMEENDHAALFRGGREYFVPMGKFPMEILGVNYLEIIKEINSQIQSITKEFKQEPPSLIYALNLAFQYEVSSGERIFEKAMNAKFPSKTLEIFQKLNGANKNHAERIKKVMDALNKKE